MLLNLKFVFVMALIISLKMCSTPPQQKPDPICNTKITDITLKDTNNLQIDSLKPMLSSAFNITLKSFAECDCKNYLLKIACYEQKINSIEYKEQETNLIEYLQLNNIGNIDSIGTHSTIKIKCSPELKKTVVKFVFDLYCSDTSLMDSKSFEIPTTLLPKPQIGFPNYSICPMDNEETIKFNHPICLKERIQIYGKVDARNITFELISQDNNISLINSQDTIGYRQAGSDVMIKDFCFKIKDETNGIANVKIRAIDSQTKETISESATRTIIVNNKINCY